MQINTGIINQLRRWHLAGLLFRTPIVGAVGERIGRALMGPTLWYFDTLPGDVRRELAAGFDIGAGDTGYDDGGAMQAGARRG